MSALRFFARVVLLALAAIVDRRAEVRP